MHHLTFALALLVGVGSLGCEAKPSSPDARVEMYAPQLDAAVDATARAWMESAAQAHALADAALASGDQASALSALSGVLQAPAPSGDAALVVRLDLAARYAELASETDDGASDAIALLEVMLPTDRSLPLDKSSARALVALGDAAGQVDDHSLAAGSYARAVRVMSKLREAEAERVLGPKSEREEPGQ